jgi:hypothetical protein
MIPTELIEVTYFFPLTHGNLKHRKLSFGDRIGLHLLAFLFKSNVKYSDFVECD